MTPETLAKIVVFLCVLFIILDWAALLFFVAPVTFPDLADALFTKLGLRKKGAVRED